MFVRLNMITSDEANAARYGGLRRLQGWLKWNPLAEDLPLKDGPENPRIKVVDIDPRTGQAPPSVKFIVPKKNKYSYFDFGKAKQYDWDKVRRVSLFSTAMRVLNLFENEDALGRRIKWSFGDQLIISARAGEKANAAYRRESGTLNFYYFNSKKNPELTIHLADSPDIVAHETGHAILDAIASDLYTSRNPQTRAIHEAVADLTAVLFAFEMDDLGNRILESTKGRLDVANAFGWIGETFGTELAQETGDTYLRTLYNENSLLPNSPNFINSNKPHVISTVLSGAIFAAFIDEFERRKPLWARASNITDYSASGFSLWLVGGIARRALFRGLDFLPPGDVNFIDVVRAMIATDQMAFPRKRDSHFRGFLVEQCLKRGIGETAEHLRPDPIPDEDPVLGLNVTRMASDSVYLEQCISNNKAFFYIPDAAAFRVTAQFTTRKSDVPKRGEKVFRHELVVKVRWSEPEKGKSIWGFNHFKVFRGTTLVIDLDNGHSLIRLTNSPKHASDGGKTEAQAFALRSDTMLHMETALHAIPH
ncbi:hypothetical protein N9W89_12115 [Hellea sp.]|nr:hypothetical protein [Hellea sp.]